MWGWCRKTPGFDVSVIDEHAEGVARDSSSSDSRRSRAEGGRGRDSSRAEAEGELETRDSGRAQTEADGTTCVWWACSDGYARMCCPSGQTGRWDWLMRISTISALALRVSRLEQQRLEESRIMRTRPRLKQSRRRRRARDTRLEQSRSRRRARGSSRALLITCHVACDDFVLLVVMSCYLWWYRATCDHVTAKAVHPSPPPFPAAPTRWANHADW